MKSIYTVFFILVSLTSFSQNNLSELNSILINELKGLNDSHGIVFFEKSEIIQNKKVKKDLRYIKKLISINKLDYEISNIEEEMSKILILDSKKTLERIIQIKTITHTEINHYEIIRYNFLIELDRTKIYLEFDENGIRSYKINNREVTVSREVVLEFGENFDALNFYKQIEQAKSIYLN
ncbi:hypothetical protein [Flavobacterium swingsii]|nr:hypothetical protein [Flavobacterium swingsii]